MRISNSESNALGTELQSSPHRAPRTARVGACPLCGSQGLSRLFSVHDQVHSVPGVFTYQCCSACRTVFQDPRVIDADLALCYPDNYYTHPYLGESSVEPSARPVPRRQWSGVRDELRRAIMAAVQQRPLSGARFWVGRVLASNRRFREQAFFGLMDELIPQSAQAGRALEVGCGAGNLLCELQRAGWTVEGVERDPLAAAKARQMSGSPVHEGDFRAVDLPLATYDLIVLYHVFEHLDDPHQGLCRVRELLKPGGCVVLCYPNSESLGARWFGARWYPWDPPRHFVLPPSSALQECARGVGLLPQRLRTTARYAAFYAANSRAYSAGSHTDHWMSVQVGLRDRALACVERGLTWLGMSVGEEVVAVLVRPATE